MPRPNLLPMRAADDGPRAVSEIVTEIPHALAEAVIPELPEADRSAVITHSGSIPSALEPGVRQGTGHPGIRPARSPEMELRITGIPTQVTPDPHLVAHQLGCRTRGRGNRRLGRDDRG